MRLRIGGALLDGGDKAAARRSGPNEAVSDISRHASIGYTHSAGRFGALFAAEKREA